MTMRRTAGLAGVTLALLLAGCHRKQPEPVEPTDQGEPAPAPTPPAPPPPAPKPAAAKKPPPAPPVSEDQQMRDDAAASGMTGPIETTNAETPAPDTESNGASTPDGGVDR